MPFLFLLFSFILNSVVQLNSQKQWSYEDSTGNGPENWPNVFKDCSEQSQSPIAISTSNVWYSSSLMAFDSSSWDDVPERADWNMINTGTSLKIELASGKYLLTEGGLDGTYRAVQLHWHWGAHDGIGSEHTVDGQIAPMELHFVHYSTKYSSFEEALRHPDGVAVLAFLYKLGNADHPGYRQIVKWVSNITYPGDSVKLRPIILLSLLSHNLNNYYRYSGSLTTPPCTEGVMWTVFKEPILISYRQMRIIRTSLLASKRKEDKKPLLNNFRPLQPHQGRNVYSNDNKFQAMLTMSSPVGITLAALFGMLVVMFFIHRA